MALYHTAYPFAGDINVLENVNFTMEFDHIGCKTMFTLTVTSNGGPAKSVTWTRGSEIQSNTWTSYDNVTMQYTHNLNVTSRRGGRYQCTLENDKPSMIAKNFKVKGIYIFQLKNNQNAI